LHYSSHAIIGKGIDNVLGEPAYIGISVSVFAFIRVACGRGRETDKTMHAVAFLAALCLFAAVIFFLTPNLGGSMG
jgi:hypothetical protein